MRIIFKHWVSSLPYIQSKNAGNSHQPHDLAILASICDHGSGYRHSLRRVLTVFFVGVNFMEKTISIRNTEITFSIWDLGGQREFVNMLPLVCNDAVAILFMFDLTRKSTLNSIKEWYRQGRGFNKTAIPFLVGTKYDHFVNFQREEQEEISNQVGSALSNTNWHRG
jgi:GTPase SAR1 family protein